MAITAFFRDQFLRFFPIKSICLFFYSEEEFVIYMNFS